MQDEWLSTTNQQPAAGWLADIDFPYKDAHDMIRYIQSRGLQDDARMVTSNGDTDLPQAFVHWWCHMRVERRRNPGKAPRYACLEKWRPIVSRWQGNQANSIDVFGTFNVWLDILFMDLTVYESEVPRERVPRKYGDTIRWDGMGEPDTRMATLNYIIEQGVRIFEERGWVEGADYWKEKCKQYLVFR